MEDKNAKRNVDGFRGGGIRDSIRPWDGGCLNGISARGRWTGRCWANVFSRGGFRAGECRVLRNQL